MTRRRRSGFSMVELFVVLTIIGLLVRVAMPRYSYVRKQAQARAAIADVRVIRDAVLNYHQDRGGWPSEAGAGQTPSGLATYLPAGFDFNRGAYVVDFEAWPPAGPTAAVANGAVIGVAIDTADPDLAVEMRKIGASGIPYFTSGNKTTFLLDGLTGVS